MPPQFDDDLTLQSECQIASKSALITPMHIRFSPVSDLAACDASVLALVIWCFRPWPDSGGSRHRAEVWVSHGRPKPSRSYSLPLGFLMIHSAFGNTCANSERFLFKHTGEN